MGRIIANLPSAVTSHATNAMVLVDEDHRIAFCNAAAEEIWGRSREEVVGRDARQLPAFLYPGPAPGAGSGLLAGEDYDVRIEPRGGAMTWRVMSVVRTKLNGKDCDLAFVRAQPATVSQQLDRLKTLHLLAEKTDRGVVVTDADLRIRCVNRAFGELLGYSSEELEGRDLRTILAASPDQHELRRRIDDGIASGRDFTDDVLLYDKAGKEIVVTATITPVVDQKSGTLENVVAILADITHTRLLEDLQRQVLAALAADAPLADIMDLLCLKVEHLAPGIRCSVLSVTDDDRLKVIASPSMPEAFSAAIDGLAISSRCGSCGTAIFRGEPVFVEDIATSPLWEDYRDLPLPPDVKGCWSIPIKLRSGKVAGTFAFYICEHLHTRWLEGIVSACSDLCALALERYEAKNRIEQLASIDTLTGLPNRSQLIEALSVAIATARRLEQPLAVLFIDVDHFKDVNDTLGHSAGDQILVEMARRLKVQLRAGDTVGRIGGDEFVVLVQGCGSEEADPICRRLLEYLAAPIAAHDLHLTMSVSIGIALFAEHGLDAESLLKHADTAMHEAKRKGPGKFQFFTEDLNQRAQDRLVLSVALREAIQNRKLRLAYQPQVSLTTGELHGVEALARWRDPVHGEIPAPRFIELAEEYGLIESIDRWGVGEACRQITLWRAAGVSVPHVSVNLSPLSFRSGDIVGIISQALEEHGLHPSDLRVEITERVMMDQHPNSFAAARAIEALGVRIAMDDFGTGYSSLSALSRLPIAELKLDRSFMLSIEQDENARALSTAVIRIGHSLGMTVVAEGVETEAQVSLLHALGCHAAQGYYFARPLAPEAIPEWLAARPAVPGTAT